MRTKRLRRTLVLVVVVTLVATASATAIAAGPSAVDGGDTPVRGAAADGPRKHASAGQEDCAFPFDKRDATGERVTVESEPGTVVTVSPSAAQTMWEIGASEKVVGVTKFADYLAGAESKSNVSGAGYTRVVTEKVVALDPDLVLAPNVVQNETVEALRNAGLTVYRFEAATSLDDIEEKTRLVGRLTGECEGAREAAERMEAEIDAVRQAVEGEERPEVVYVLGPSGYVAGSGTYINEAIEAAGGENVAATANLSFYQPMSAEVLVEQDPEFVVKPEGSPLPQSAAFNETTAVQEGNVVVVDDDYVSQAAPRLVQPIHTMAESFHPEAYAAAGTTPTGSPAPTDSSTPTDAPSTTSTSSPGFGPVAALLALAGAVALARR